MDAAANKFGLDMIEAVKDPEAKEKVRTMMKMKMAAPHKKNNCN